MPRDGTEARRRLIEAAEELFAAKGIDRVRLQDVIAAAGSRNDSAVQYHFGSRDGLVAAILSEHGKVVRAEMRESTEALAPSRAQMTQTRTGRYGRLWSAIETMAVPFSRQLLTASGRCYLQILAQVFDRGETRFPGAPEVPSTVVHASARAAVRAQLTDLSPEIQAERIARISDFIVHATASRASQLARGEQPSLDHEDFVSNMISMSASALLAPIDK